MTICQFDLQETRSKQRVFLLAINQPVERGFLMKL